MIANDTPFASLLRLGGSPTSISAPIWDTDPRLLRGVNPAIAAYDAGVASGAIPIAAPVFTPPAPNVVYSAPVETPATDGATFRVGRSGTLDAPQPSLLSQLFGVKLSSPAPGAISVPQGAIARQLAQGAPGSPSLTISPGYIAGKTPARGNGVSGATVLASGAKAVDLNGAQQGSLILLALLAVGAYLALRA